MRNDGLGQASNKTGRNTTQREREEKRILSGRDKTVPCFQAESSQVGRTTALTRDWDHLDLVAVTTNSKTTEKPKRGSRSSEALVGSGSRVEQQETITTACHHSRWDGTRMGLYGCAKALHGKQLQKQKTPKQNKKKENRPWRDNSGLLFLLHNIISCKILRGRRLIIILVDVLYKKKISCPIGILRLR